jgi:hypothetical protein
MASGDCRKKLATLSRDISGVTTRAQVAHKECEGQVTHEFCCMTFAEMTFRPGPCEDGSLAHLVGRLEGTVEVLRREENRRGCFSGQWQLREENTDRVLAAGELRGTVGCGTHRPPATDQPCEQCDVPRHYEGVFTGQVLAPGDRLFGAPICATLAGTGPLEPDQKQHMVVEGVVIQCCPE